MRTDSHRSLFFIFAFENTAKLRNNRFVNVADFVIGYSLYLWYRADTRSAANRATFTGVADLALFMFQVGFLILPYHLVKTRKRRRWISMMITLLIVILASIAGVLLGKY